MFTDHPDVQQLQQEMPLGEPTTYKQHMAGNILTSTAILYSRTLPSEAFKMFEILNFTVITRKAFFCHQRKYLQPTVSSVWKLSQELLLTTLKDKGSSLVLGGDGWSDIPGHSAKYGSYSILELTCNKIVDFNWFRLV